ncbi:MAG TPA: hypothetical protein VFT41_09370, partial [Gemmatimonadaceae bacterium]|nr:hypothetical protein [Gemmatimonadaceae bacterium]
MLRSRATQLLTAVSLAGIVLALPARPAQAQAGLTHLDDATMVPRGEWRLQAVTAWTRFNARFAPSGSGKTTIPLGADFTFDSLGTAQLPALAGTQNAIQALTGSPFKLTLGATSAATDARVVVMPMSLEYGLFHRLTLGAMIPLVRTRMNIMLRVNPLGTEANVGLNPAAVNLASLARDSSVVAQLTNAAAALQATLKSCQADAGSDPNCPQILANEQDVNTLLQSAASFTNAFAAVYGQSAQARGSAVVPLSGSAADNLVKARLVSYDSAFQSYLAGSAPRITSSPAAAGGPLGTADFGTLLHDPAIAGFDSVKSTIRIGVGDLELSARLLLFDQFDDSAVSANPAGLHARATLTGIYRVPTGQLAAAGNPLDIATGHGT